ncbi:MAG: metal ABC transporter substrate-binding protein [Lachnospiraceae bacterium]|nr:metal ABC transporter substrate-binding protein [Lachnospiraceae bacterium]
MKKNRVLCQLLALVLIGTFSLFGCAAKKTQPDAGLAAEKAPDKLNVVTTLFPYYDFVRQVAGDDVKLTLVVPAGMDSHSFEPTPADMRLIQSADVLISNGGAMEHWLTEVLGAVDTEQMTVVTMMDHVNAVEEQLVEGMEAEAHDHDHEAGEADEADESDESDEADDHKSYVDYDGHEEEIEYDEHIWTSPVNAMTMVEVIRDTLAEADPEHAADYQAHAEAYLGELQQIDAGLREVSENRVRNMIVIGDKFPFRYLADEYQLDYRAAFSGCSTDTEPSAKTIAYLIDKIREEQIPVVYYLELSTHRVSEIIGEETGATPLLLHSCHNVTRQQFDAGVTYVELMRGNIESLRKGLDE